jgi:hypothetical protein
MRVSRRRFVTSALGLGASLTLGDVSRAAARALTSPLPQVDPRLLPSSRRLADQVLEMVALGPRFTATRAHRQFIDSLQDGFERAGLAVSRDTFTFTQWLAESWSLELLDGSAAGPVPVSSYFTFSGPTSPAGVEGELVYVGAIPSPSVSGNPLDVISAKDALARVAAEAAADISAAIAAIPGGVKGRIALVDAPIAPLQVGALDPELTYRHQDARNQVHDYDDYKRAWTTLLSMLELLAPFQQAGAAGVVVALDASAANAAGQFTPFINSPTPLPALIVDRDTGTKLRQRAAAHPRARLTLRAQVNPGTASDSLVAILPGDGSSDELIVVNTHTDGMNAFEENAGIALVALAEYFASQPAAARKRTLVFSAVTGHFGPGLPQTQGFIDRHPDLVKRAAASLTIEHFGATEWIDDLARGYHATGQIELGAIFHSQTPIAAVGIESVRAADLVRTELLRPIGDTFFGVGASLDTAGVPSIAFIAGPNCLLSFADGGHLDKFDGRRMHRELAWSADLVARLDKVPAQVLAAGDSALLSGVGQLQQPGHGVPVARRPGAL